MGITIILACGQIIDRVIFQQDSSAQETFHMVREVIPLCETFMLAFIVMSCHLSHTH